MRHTALCWVVASTSYDSGCNCGSGTIDGKVLHECGVIPGVMIICCYQRNSSKVDGVNVGGVGASIAAAMVKGVAGCLRRD